MTTKCISVKLCHTSTYAAKAIPFDRFYVVSMAELDRFASRFYAGAAFKYLPEIEELLPLTISRPQSLRDPIIFVPLAKDRTASCPQKLKSPFTRQRLFSSKIYLVAFYINKTRYDEYCPFCTHAMSNLQGSCTLADPFCRTQGTIVCPDTDTR